MNTSDGKNPGGSGQNTAIEDVSTGDSKLAVTADYLEDNERIKALPRYLKQFIVDQQYDKYTPVNHAVWRYVMRKNYAFLKDYAHESYLGGLRKTGIGIEKIPSITDMNEILDRIGWAAVTVDGFIPPAAFMAYQAYHVLVIAADMRQINHIEYTPAPDIIHEAAGHAPIIAEPEYAEYLRRIGLVGSKAMSSKKDYELYEAIRHLSILKETPDADPIEVDRAEKDVEFKQSNLGEPSEMTLLSRLHWWTVEYGLIGDINRPKIFGAGLLSSIGEATNCMTDKVKKLPYNLDTANYAFDITKMQPQLFVTPDFKHLNTVVDEFSNDMAYKVGGMSGLKKAIECQANCTAQYSSGLQVSGTYSATISSNGTPVYIKTGTSTALAYDYKELEGHGRDYHRDGFGSPVGRIKGTSTPLESLSDGDLASHGIATGKDVTLEYESGVIVKGRLDRVLRKDSKIILMSFSNCTVTYGSDKLFEPDWGLYDMAVGESIVSVFSGAADKDSFHDVGLVSKTRTVKVDYDDTTRALHALYQKIRDVRDGVSSQDAIPEVWADLKAHHPKDWLCSLEIYELLHSRGWHSGLKTEVKQRLEKMQSEHKEYAKLIADGLLLVHESK